MAVRIGIARETAPGERRVAITPETCRKFVALGAAVTVERGLGRHAHFADEAYVAAGAEQADDAAAEIQDQIDALEAQISNLGEQADAIQEQIAELEEQLAAAEEGGDDD